MTMTSKWVKLRKLFTYFAHYNCKSESNRLAPMSESEKVGQNSNSKLFIKKICCRTASNSYSFEDYFFLRSDKMFQRRERT